MRFECYTEIQAPKHVKHAPEDPPSHHECFEIAMDTIELADKLGFDVFNSIDHHYFEDFGISANPLAMWTAAAQQTDNIRFRTLLHNVSQHNPTSLAGQITEADHLTNGRLELGLGRGHAWIFPKASMSLDHVRPRSEEAYDVLNKALTGETFDYHGEYFDVENVTIAPEPYQDEYKVFTGGTSDSTYRDAGRRGWGIVVPPLLPLDILEEPLDIYRDACAEHGNEPDILFVHAVYMERDAETVKKEGKRALKAFLECNAWPTNDLPPEDEIRRNDFDFYLSGALEDLAATDWEDMVDQDIVWAGTPQEIVDKIGYLQENLEGLGGVAIMPFYGGMKQWKSTKILELFAEEVMPHFRD